MNKKQKTMVAVIAIMAVIIIILLLRKRGTLINNYEGADLGNYGLPALNISLKDLVVPNLSRFVGVSSCGCGDSKFEVPQSQYKSPSPTEIEYYQSIANNAQPRISYASSARKNGVTNTFVEAPPTRNY